MLSATLRCLRRCGVSRTSIALMSLLLPARALVEACSAGLLAALLALLLTPDAVPQGWSRVLLRTVEAGSPLSPLLLLGGALLLFRGLLAPLLGWWRGRLIVGWTQALSLRALDGEIQRPASARLDRHAQGSNTLVNHVAPRIIQGRVLPLLELLSESLLALMLFALLLSHGLWPGLLLCTALLLGAGASHLLLQRFSGGGLRARTLTDMQRWVTDSVACLREIHLYARERSVLAGYRPLARRFAHAMAQERTLADMQLPIVEALFLLALGGVALLLPGHLALGNDSAPLALFGVAAVRLLPSLRRMATSLRTLAFGRASFNAFAASLTDPAEPGSRTRQDGAAPGLLFDAQGLVYRYPGAQQDVLQALDLRCAAGQWLALSGPSGAGKSTLVDLLLGELHALAGTLRWSTPTPGIGYAGALTTLVQGSLRDNLGFHQACADDARLHEALWIAGIEHLLQRLPGGFDEDLGSVEQRLSGGERQRIGLARAVLHASDLLILDEATAALDMASEAAFLQRLRQCRPGTAVLQVTHRESSLAQFDRLLRLAHGRLSECDQATDNSAAQRLSQTV